MKQIEDMKNKMEKKPKLTKKERRALAEGTSKMDKPANAQKNDKKLSKKERRALRVSNSYIFLSRTFSTDNTSSMFSCWRNKSKKNNVVSTGYRLIHPENK